MLRSKLNAYIVNKVKQCPDEEDDIMKQVNEDVEHGAMTEPTELDEAFLQAYGVARRIPVVTWKSNGKKKVRGVDHFSENGAKAVTGFMEKVRTQGLDWLVVMALALMQCHHKVTLSKRDVKRAFRNCPLNQTYKELMAIVFPYNGKVMAAQHLAAPFGSVSAVYAWDRLSNAIANIILRATKAACAKWVDDFFCSHRSDVELHGMKVLDELLSLLGLATDVDKAVTNAEEMEVLGVQAKVDNVQQYISTRLAEDKAHKYSHHLEQCVACDYTTPSEAQKIASRFQFAISCAQDNIGRAWIRPFYARGNDPMQNCRVSNWARQASWWWILYCAYRLESRRYAQSKP